MLLTGVSLGQTTERVSVHSTGAQGIGPSRICSISADGNHVAFESRAGDLVQGDTNGKYDIFVHDLLTGETARVSVDSFGNQGDGHSGSLYGSGTSISADGRFVAFGAAASNLVLGDTNGQDDCFVHDRLTGLTKRVSVSSMGLEGNRGSSLPSISADGRFVSFQSDASNLVSGDTNGYSDIFVHDCQTGVTKRVSVDSFGIQGTGVSNGLSSLSADGRCVAFASTSSNLVPVDTNSYTDIFIHDWQTGSTELVSVDSYGGQAYDWSANPSISADGRFVAFDTEAYNLVPGDTNGDADVFVHDRLTGLTKRVSVDSLGLQGDEDSCVPSLSADGRFVAFHSPASNLVPEDTNGAFDVFIHDCETGVTERVSVDGLGVQGNEWSYRSLISADGRMVAFESEATNLVLADTNNSWDIFVHDRWNGLGENSIYLTGPSTAPVLSPLDFSWQTTRGNSQYWLLFSQNKTRSVIRGHNFDIGNLHHGGILATGTHPPNGIGSFTSPPPSAFAAGHTIYFEVAAQDAAGILYDSNLHAVTFH